MYAYTFICPKKAKATSLILPDANTEMKALFLEPIAKDFKDDNIIMQVDQAQWYQSKDLNIPENIAWIEPHLQYRTQPRRANMDRGSKKVFG